MTPPMRRGGGVVSVAALMSITMAAGREQPAATPRSLTAIDGIKVDHHTLQERPTGCTVVLTEGGAAASVDVRGAAPGTRETDLLDPMNTGQQVHAIVLAGGSVFGLAAAEAIIRAVRAATRIPGYPAARDLKESTR